MPRKTLEELFSTRDDDRAAVGVVPVENSAAGSINKISELQFRDRLSVFSATLRGQKGVP